MWGRRQNRQVTETQPLLNLDHVGRLRAGREVVRDLSLTLERGQVLGLLGVNGAGKSTTLAMLAGALRPTSGRILLDGHDLAEEPEQARRLLGWLPENAPSWPELSVGEHLAAHARLHGLRGRALRQACTNMLERLHLEPLRKRLAHALSQGQRQRLGLACALLHQPALLILDEPGNGLDPVQAADLRALIRAHATDGGAVVLSTHLLPEVTAVCDRAAILHEGCLRHDAPLETTSDTLELTLAEAVPVQQLTALAPIARVEARDERHFGIVLAPDHDTKSLLQALLAHDATPTALTPGHGTLEREFMAIATTPVAEAA